MNWDCWKSLNWNLGFVLKINWDLGLGPSHNNPLTRKKLCEKCFQMPSKITLLKQNGVYSPPAISSLYNTNGHDINTCFLGTTNTWVPQSTQLSICLHFWIPRSHPYGLQAELQALILECMQMHVASIPLIFAKNSWNLQAILICRHYWIGANTGLQALLNCRQ